MEFSRSDRNFLKSLSFTYANRLSCVSVVGSMLPMGADKDRNIVNRDQQNQIFLFFFFFFASKLNIHSLTDRHSQNSNQPKDIWAIFFRFLLLLLFYDIQSVSFRNITPVKSTPKSKSTQKPLKKCIESSVCCGHTFTQIESAQWTGDNKYKQRTCVLLYSKLLRERRDREREKQATQLST